MAFNKKQYDYYEWADIEDLFKQLKTQHDRFSITTDNTVPSSKVNTTITPDDIQTIYDRLDTLMKNKFIAAESNISIRNVKVPNRFDYLDTTHLSLIQTELDKIAALRPCFTHCDFSSCFDCAQGSGNGDFGFTRSGICYDHRNTGGCGDFRSCNNFGCHSNFCFRTCSSNCDFTRQSNWAFGSSCRFTSTCRAQ